MVLCALFPSLLYADASLYLSPARASYVVGETFEVRVLADTGGTTVNAAEAELSFDPRSLSVESISTANSILATYSTEPSFSNQSGKVGFSGWTGTPYAGSDGLLLTIRFKALRTVTSRASLVAGAILAVDESSNIITSMQSGLYAVEPVAIVPDVPERGPDPESIPRSSALLPPVLESVPPIDVGERFAVYGVTDPSTRVWVRVVGPSMEGETAVWSDINGSFSYTSGEIAGDGIYRVSAEIEGAEGVRSEPSDRIIVEVRPAGIAGSAAAAAGFLSTALPFVALLVASSLFVGYIIHRRRPRA